MTKEEYTQERNKLIELYGKPTKDYDGSPTNECARQLNKLKGQYLASIRHENKQKRLEIQQNKPANLTELVSDIPPDKQKEYRKQPLPEIIIDDKDLKGFSPLEQEILKAHFLNLDLTHSQLANIYNKSRQFISGLLRSKETKLLEVKYFNEVLRLETMKSLIRAVKAGDNRIIEGASEFLKIMQGNEKEAGSRPIEDKVAEQKLKELADQLADQEKSIEGL